ncbi:MAG: RNA polymerase sigma factor [Firmicutes bacterium]|nr:RNA polymerase sigma factor [Bacillota bacterium]
MSGLSDTVLVAAAQQGDLEAFGVLVKRHEKWVYNLAYRMLGHREDASDLAQEAFLKAYRALSRFRGASSFKTWLYRITSNLCLDALRRRTPQRQAGELKPTVADPSPGPHERAEERERLAKVHAAIVSLPDHQRLCLILRDLQGLSYEEIASAAAVNVGTVKSRLNRARLALRDLLEDKEPPGVELPVGGPRLSRIGRVGSGLQTPQDH